MPKNKTHVIDLEYLYSWKSAKSIAMKFSMWYTDDLSYEAHA